MVNPTPYKEKELLLRIAAGDEDAFEALYRKHRDKALAIIMSFVKSYSDAEDILQDIFLQLWTGRKNLTNVDEFDNYLFISVRNAIGKSLQKKERQQKIMAQYRFEQLPVVSQQEQAVAKDVQLLVNEALEQLPDQQRRVYLMSRREGLTHEQIGVALQLSSKTISNIITLVLNHIRSFLNQHGYFLSLIWLFYGLW